MDWQRINIVGYSGKKILCLKKEDTGSYSFSKFPDLCGLSRKKACREVVKLLYNIGVMYKLTGYDYNTSYAAALLLPEPKGRYDSKIREEWFRDLSIITVTIYSCKRNFDIFGKPKESADLTPKYQIYIWIK